MVQMVEVNFWSKRFKSFLVSSQGPKHKLSSLPLLQGSLPKNKGSSGNNFLRRICQRGLKIHSPSKSKFFWKKKIDPANCWKIFVILLLGRRKMKSCKSSETSFPKVWSRTEPPSGGERLFKVLYFCKTRNFEGPLTPGGWIHLASNFGKTCFRRSRHFIFVTLKP